MFYIYFIGTIFPYLVNLLYKKVVLIIGFLAYKYTVYHIIPSSLLFLFSSFMFYVHYHGCYCLMNSYVS